MSQLKSMIQDLINGRKEQAEVALHNFVVAKTQAMIGEAKGKKFEITWEEGYGENDGKSATHSLDWFDGDNGFSASDRKKLDGLEVGEDASMGGPTDSVTITRVS